MTGMNPHLPTEPPLSDTPARWIVLRLASLADDDLLAFTDESADGGRHAGAARPWHVLVVDDDDEVHRAIDLALGGVVIYSRPLQIRHCHSAATARSQLVEDGQHLDLVLLDVVMETVDAGLDLLEEIRALPATRDLPVLLHTGQPGRAPESRVRSRYDISGYLMKSTVTRPSLIAALESALAGKALT